MKIQLFNSPFYLTLAILIGNHVWADEQPASAEGVEFFEKKIRPVLVEHCYECHAADSKAVRGGLRVDNAAVLHAGGDSGPAVVPGDPGAGTLLEAIRYETFEMPPKQKLPANVVKDFETWIAMGAPDPREGGAAMAAENRTIDLEAGRQFWSFRPIQKGEVPQVKNREWPHSDIDRFVLAAQEQANLQPGPDVDDLTLLRRLYFDLIGLPPTYEQIQEFLASDPATRVEHAVQQLLNSPKFGERWGRHWLDLARYAESTGGGRSALYGESWRYRDYVIQAFNDDVPFDQFIREQIAGDLLPSADYRERTRQLIATAFLMLGPHNYENQDKVQLRMDVVDEQIDTVGRVFLGMTIGCARCHDHKFDPVPTADYYALAGIFRSTDSLVEGNVSRWESHPLPQSPEEESQAQAHLARIEARKKEVQLLKTRIETLKLRFKAILTDNVDAQLVGTWTESQSVSGYLGEHYQHSSLTSASATYRVITEPGTYEVQLSYTPAPNRTKRAKVLVHDADGVKEFLINQQLAPNVDGVFHTLGKLTAGDAVTVVIQPTENAPTIIDAVRLISAEAESEEATRNIQTELAAAVDRQKQIEKEIKEDVLPKRPQLVTVKEMDVAEDYNICIRGNVHNLGEPVKRGFLSVIAGPEVESITSESSGRLELANWIADERHPLTARVYVNRVWMHLFGAGIVRTVDNFGLPGELPSHPDLLDALAVDFIEQGWSTKQLIRKIVLSRTYQLASSADHVVESDPDNRLLTRQNRRRMSAEAIHDSLLQISGLLDETPAESLVRAGTKSEYGYQFDFGKRAVYLPVFRNRLPDLFSVFDFPNPNLPQGRRTASTISPQALFLMNSEFADKAALATAKRVLNRESDLSDRLEWLTLTLLNRHPSSDELLILTEYLSDDPDSLQRWTQVCQSLYGSLDFRFVQ